MNRNKGSWTYKINFFNRNEENTLLELNYKQINKSNKPNETLPVKDQIEKNP